MANTGKGLAKKESSLMFRDISPPHKWDQDSHSHYLRLTVPGFASRDITLHMDKYGHLVVRGSRELSHHKHLSFEETFHVPDDANLDDAEGFFENDHTYCVTIPKTKNIKLGQTNGSEGVKLEDHVDPKKADFVCPKPGTGVHNELPHPSPLFSIDKFKKDITVLIAILVSIYVVWLSRQLKN